ncbi:MAG TPA: hypothetical protein VEV43_02685 [Actinomycetota bacterium]|nr:hypothetical protein [Actinomycetota bacterium]
MRKLALAATALLISAVAPAATAVRGGPPLGPHFSSPNVEYLGHVPLENDTAGARVVGRYLFVTTSRALTIYDLKDPLGPVKAGWTPMPQSPYFPQEDVDTNGRILLVPSIDGVLNVVDVEDKTNPRVIGRLDGGASHTNTCVLDCTYSYASGGQIVDLRDPANPKLAGDWKKTAGLPPSSTHDVTEVAPGMIVTSGPIALLDARKDPTKPVVRAFAWDDGPGGIVHSNLWPRGMRDRYLLVGGESAGPRCTDAKASFTTYDTRGWRDSKTFRKLDQYRPPHGTYTDGNPAANTFCMHWFDDHPEFRDGGLVAVAWYEHGTRFVEVGRGGRIREAGHFLPVGASTSAAYWVTDEIVYTADYQRGIDILRFDLGAPSG